MSILVDTSALYALLDADDANHARAAAFVPELPGRDPFVHNYVTVEVTALAQRRLGHHAVRALHKNLLPAGLCVAEEHRPCVDDTVRALR